MTASASILERFGEDAEYLSQRLREDSTPEQMKNLGILPSIAYLMQQAADFIDRQSRIIAEKEAEVAAVAAGACYGCGSTKSLDAIRAKGCLSCCPERKMLTAAEWRDLAIAAESSRDAAVEAEREACAIICEQPLHFQHPTKPIGVIISSVPSSPEHAAAIRSRAQAAREVGARK